MQHTSLSFSYYLTLSTHKESLWRKIYALPTEKEQQLNLPQVSLSFTQTEKLTEGEKLKLEVFFWKHAIF